MQANHVVTSDATQPGALVEMTDNTIVRITRHYDDARFYGQPCRKNGSPVTRKPERLLAFARVHRVLSAG